MSRFSKIIAVTLPLTLVAGGAIAATTETTRTTTQQSTERTATTTAQPGRTTATSTAQSTGRTATASTTTRTATQQDQAGTAAGQTQAQAANNNVLDAARNSGQFNTFLRAVNASGLSQNLKGQGPYTIFAPTDAAFQKMGQSKVESLMRPENKAELARILQYHVVPQAIPSSAAQTRPTEVRTAEGEQISVERTPAGVRVENASVTQADIQARNGIIHGIDTVLMPQQENAAGAATTRTTTTTTTQSRTPSAPTSPEAPEAPNAPAQE